MLSKYLKTSSEKILIPISRKIPTTITPNQITSFGLFFSFFVGISFSLGRIQLAGFLLLLTGLFDLLDGAYSRYRGQATEFGAFWDSTADRYSDLIIIGGVIIYFTQLDQLFYVVLSIITMIGFIMVSYTKARAENIIRACNIGLMERPERILVLSTGSIIDRLKPTIWILAILSHQTAIQRIWFAYKEITTGRLHLKEQNEGSERNSRGGEGYHGNV